MTPEEIQTLWRENTWEEPNWQEKLNCETWRVTRYENNPSRYFITAKEELGTQLKQYKDIGYWQGGTEFENRVYEEIRYAYRKQEGIKTVRTRVFNNLVLYEIQSVYKDPLSLYAVINSDKVLSADVKLIKGGARYLLK